MSGQLTKVCMSPLAILKSQTPKFSIILSFFEDLGMQIKSFCRLHFIMICAGVLEYLLNSHVKNINQCNYI